MNSRLRVSNQSETAELVAKLAKSAADRGTRALIVVFSPPDNWLKHLATSLNSGYWGQFSDIDRADRISALLGSERNMAVVQLGNIPDLGLLAATAGTLKAGGVLIVGTDIPIKDSDSNTTVLTENVSHSTVRLENLAKGIASAYPDTVLCLQAVAEHNDASATTGTAEPSARELSLPTSVLNSGAKAEQNNLLDQTYAHLAEHSESCIVITGRRGRGKSTLLARIALHLNKSPLEICITALHESALGSFRQHAEASTARYLSPEAAANHTTDVLLVDEAASFPLTLLEQYAQKCRHLILCSTTEGYEASGRALDVRLLTRLSHSTKHLLHLEPLSAWRWGDDDPLEQFTDQLLLKGTPTISFNTVISQYETCHLAASHCRIKQLTQQQLVSDEQLLREVYALLNATHYQTTTKDLEHLLDAPTVQLWVQMLGASVVGLLLLESEGMLPISIHSAIVARQRRLKNQLLPQLLAQMADEASALPMRFGRVVRLAVAPELRRLGLASQLVSSMTQSLAISIDKDAGELPRHTRPPVSQQLFDALGASFASDDCSLAFWQSQGYTEFHRGFRTNPRTGKHAVAVLRCFEPITQGVLAMAVDIHKDNEHARLAHQSCPVKAKTNSEKSLTQISERDIRLLSRFADGQRSLHDTFAALQRLAIFLDVPIENKTAQSRKQHEVELRACVKRWIHTL